MVGLDRKLHWASWNGKISPSGEEPVFHQETVAKIIAKFAQSQWDVEVSFPKDRLEELY
jgi:hypothetical protein